MIRIISYFIFALSFIPFLFASTRRQDRYWDVSMWNPKYKIAGEDFIKLGQETSIITKEDSAQAMAKKFEEIDFNQMESFKNLDELNEIFSLFLSKAILIDPNAPDGTMGKRRIPWLINWDYCFARAAFAVDILKDMPQYRNKLKTFFVFGGTLRGKWHYVTDDIPMEDKYFTSWSYHVVLAAKFKNQIYILDPSADFKKLSTLEKWMKETVLTPNKSKYSLCSVFSTTPSDSCLSLTEAQFYNYLNDNKRMLEGSLRDEVDLFYTIFGQLTDRNNVYKTYILDEKYAYWKWPTLIPPRGNVFELYPISTVEPGRPIKKGSHIKTFSLPGAKWIKACTKWVWKNALGRGYQIPKTSASSRHDYWGFSSLKNGPRVLRNDLNITTTPFEYSYCSTAQPGDKINVGIAKLPLNYHVRGEITHFLIAK